MAKRIKAMAMKDVADGKDPGRKRHYLDVIGDNGKWNGKIALIPEALDEPLRRKKPTTWFVNSMSDLFHEGVPFEFVDRVFGMMASCSQHTFQILTKRPERMAGYLEKIRVQSNGLDLRRSDAPNWMPRRVWSQMPGQTTGVGMWPLSNVWLGTSCEDQKRYDERRHHLLACPAAVRFLSLEPLLGPIDLGDDFWESGNRVEWVIVGGESGHGARPCNVAWVRSIVEQCKAAGVSCFVKQLGAKPFLDVTPCTEPESLKDGLVRVAKERVESDMVRFVGDSKGGDPAEWPESLRVRQFPQAVAHA